MHFPQTTKVLTQASAESTVELLRGKLLLQRRPRRVNVGRRRHGKYSVCQIIGGGYAKTTTIFEF